MAEIRMTPTWLPRAETAAEAQLPLDGDPGFAVMAPLDLTSWPEAGAMPAVQTAEAMAADPLTRWLEGMLGLTADVAAPPTTDPVPIAFGVPVSQAGGNTALPEDAPQPTGTTPAEMWVMGDATGDPAAPAGPAGNEVPVTDAPPAAGARENGMMHADSRGLSFVVAVAGSAPQIAPAPAMLLPPLAQDPGPGPAGAASGTGTPPAAPVGLMGPNVEDGSGAVLPVPLPPRPDRSSGMPDRGAVAADRDAPADRGADAGPLRPALAGPGRSLATGTGMAGPEAVDPGAPIAVDQADPAMAPREIGPREIGLREIGPGRAGTLPPPGQAEPLPGVDARPSPEFRMTEAPRLASAIATGDAQTAPDPRPVIRQVADALIVMRGDRTEIALAPEELGRIRLVMSGPDRGQITLWAERPETLELVRRNADLLTQQLAEAGVTADSLDFRRDDRRSGSAAQPLDLAETDEAQTPAPSLRVSLAPAPLSDRRIDIRL